MTLRRIRPLIIPALLALALYGLGARASYADEPAVVPRAGGLLGAIPQKFEKYDVVAVPDRDEAEWWAGGPSVVRDREGNFWMAARMRTADAPLGKRGYEIRIFKSADGVKFTQVHALRRDDVPLPGFERPALLVDPKSGKFKLYACGRLPNSRGKSPATDSKNGDDSEDPWCIFKFDDAARPDQFAANTARAVIVPPPGDSRAPSEIVGQYVRPAPVPEGYKDPVILFTAGQYHAYVIGVLRNSERTFHFTSADGVVWKPVGGYSHSILDLAGWHNFAVRPASVVPLGVGYLFVYEGSDTRWPDPVYNIVTGLGFTFDLEHIQDLTPDAPLIVSPTPGRLHTWRYSHWMWVDDELWVYAEVENPNGSHEIRRYRLER